ncbi:MAG: hypothetical protein HYR62_01980 [Actinobacteria bacterium]|nr:hypothetical protein [Actinomycetota bacterium]MBI3687252.1 hypothetical protein [Actinomycetota bacterium]
MARMRYLKPEFWTDAGIVKLSPFARLLYMGCWNFALCDQGHLPDDPFSLRLQILPADDVDAQALVEELVAAGKLRRITARDGRRYLHAHRLPDHQKTDKRWAARCPVCTVGVVDGPSGATSPEAEGSQSDPPVPLPDSPELSTSPATSPELSEPLPDSPKLSGTHHRRGGEGSNKEQLLAPASGERERRRPRDDLWDAIVDACHVDTTSMTGPARGACNRAVAELRKIGASPGEIARHAEAFREHWPGVTLTPSALVRRWSEVGQPPPRAAPAAPTPHATLWAQAERGRA